jgi:outer membrane protein, heavy metal efflux system
MVKHYLRNSPLTLSRSRSVRSGGFPVFRSTLVRVDGTGAVRRRASLIFCFIAATVGFLGYHCLFPASVASAGEVGLQGLIGEALNKNPEILAAEARMRAAGYRVPQARSLPDPMFMFGYQNEGFQKFTIGDEPSSQGMFSLSQMFYFPGKRDLKAEMAVKDTESLAAMYDATKLRIVTRVKELYYDLFLAHKTMAVLHDRTQLFSRIENAAIARYASGMGAQQEVVMAQTEKYMIVEKEEMQKQRMDALEGMINTTVGRSVTKRLDPPSGLPSTVYADRIDDLLVMAKEKSPEVRSREKMLQGAEAKIKMAEKEYYPDVTIGASYYPRTKGFLDMWALTATVNLPIFSRTKQSQAVLEAASARSQAKGELQATQYMIDSAIRENYAMVKTAEKLLRLYKESLIPKTYQDFELALSGYVSGKTEAITVITRLKGLLDYELLYWTQYMEREKAIARLEAITGSSLAQVSKAAEEQVTKDRSETPILEGARR